MGFREMAGIRFKTLREEVASAIRMKILNGELEPGTRIVEQDMAAQLGVSRAPVREALRQIEENRYEETLRQEGYQDIMKYGVSFYRKECMVKAGR